MRGYGFETDEHRAPREQARRFASREIAPHANEWEEAEEFPRELYPRFAKSGLLGIAYPEEVGGSGSDVAGIRHAGLQRLEEAAQDRLVGERHRRARLRRLPRAGGQSDR